jgi:ABC-type nickel/cobalt efflux system permease component RcnA
MRHDRFTCGVVLAMLITAESLAAPQLGSAHPLGNFSISHYTAIRIEPNAIVLRYLLDLAEIPTFQEIQDARIVPQAEHPSLAAYLAHKVEALQDGLILELNGRRLPLRAETSEVIFPPGAGGLPTLKLGILYRAILAEAALAKTNELRYRDLNIPGRAGWKEIVATGDQGITLVSSSVAEQDRSRQLMDYPTDLLNSPPQELEARVVFAPQAQPPAVTAIGSRHAEVPGSVPPSPAATSEVQGQIAPARLEANRQMTPRSSFTELMATKQLGFGVALLAIAVAAGLGAFHALEPGHGKTVVAAYLVGSRGTAWHALILGLIVTGSHTAGVYLLGVVTLFASRYVVPEQLYPWLGVISGATIAALGLSLFLRRYAESAHLHTHEHAHGRSHHHSHPHPSEPHPHAHGPRSVPFHSHGGQPHDHRAAATVSLRELVALGVTGGIVPCPAALVVLLSALALHRVSFGLLLIVAFSIGLAVVLIAIGLLMVYARRFMSWFQGEGAVITRWLPLTSAAVITVFGVAIVVQAFVAAGVLQIQI